MLSTFATLRPGRRVCIAVLAALMTVTVARAETASPEKKVGSVRVRAFADRASLVPGGIVNMAVTLTMDDDWHIYWRNPGGLTGMPTRFDWKLPEGFRVGRTLFPSPRAKYEPTLEETSFIHAGSATFLTPILVPDSVKPGQNITLGVEVSWLACKKECIPGKANVSLTLPVKAKSQTGATDNPADAANTEVFKKARASMPEPIEKAKHVKLSFATDPQQPRPGDSATAIVTLDIARGHHMQSHKPKQEELIACVLYVEPIDGAEVGEVEYPKPHERNDKLLGLLSEFSGTVSLRVPLTFDKDAGLAGRWLRGVLQYQICNDAGTCFPPQWIEFVHPIRMAGGEAPKEEAYTATQAGPTAGHELPKTPNDRNSGVAALTPDASSVDGASRGFFAGIEYAFLRFGYLGVLGLAFCGGLVLNVMPCVLPVISIKVLSFVRQAGEHRGRIFLLGAAYCAGIMVFFTLLAVLFWQTGQGWGQHFQRPHVVLLLAAIVTAFALSLFGVFAVFPPKIINDLGQKAEGEGPGSAFATGVLATMLGTACTAPMLSAAVGAASRYPGPQGAAIFLAVGFGMAFPFLLLAAQPSWLRFVPKPGPWMGTFEALMGFLLLGTAIWLMNPLRDQIGDWGLLLSLIFLLFVALAAWVKGRIGFGDAPARKARLYAVMIGLLALGWLIPFRWLDTIPRLRADVSQRRKLVNDGKLYALLPESVKQEVPPWKPDWSRGLPWLEYDPALVARYAAAGYTVFVDFTASWCVNCKANLKTSIDIAPTRALLRELNVVTFEADYTNEDPTIKAALARFGKAGVPLYLVYAPNKPDSPEILPELLTPGIVADALRRAGPSKVSLAAAP